MSKLLCQNCKGEMRWNPDAPAYRCSDPGCRCETEQGRFEHVGKDCTMFLWLLDVPDDTEEAETHSLTGDTVTLKLHDGDPGPELTDHLMFGDGMPQEYTFSKGGTATFVMPDVTERAPRRWWQLSRLFKSAPKRLTVRGVSMWSDGQPVKLLDIRPIPLTGGGTLTLRDIARPTGESTP